jgi:SWI/SNF-related matrix-associated actin-dependent regulator 1 of chromatin subfamily A
MAFTDIEFVERYKLIFKKAEWAEADVDLARSLNFSFSGQNIVCDLTKTGKRALYEFLTTCMSHIMLNKNYAEAQKYIYEQLTIRYNELHIHFDSNYLKKLPYYDKLYKHQKESIYYAASRKFSLLALEQGLGKTATAASVSIVMDFKRTLIICPSVVKWSWFRDLTSDTFKFHPMYFSIVDANKSRGITGFQEKFVIINYDIVSKYKELLTSKHFDCIIFDECHYLKGNTLRTKACIELVRHHKDAKVILLSGTPIKNRINDIFNYLKLSEHNLGKNHAKFLRDYTIFSKGRMGLRVTGGKNLDLLYKHLSNFILRKTKEECLDLPDKIVTKYYFKLEEYMAEYEAAMEEIAKTRDISNIHSSLHTLNVITSKSKVKGIIELAEQIVEQGRKPIIFAGYNAPLDMLQGHFGSRCVRIDGSVNSYERDKLITRFKTDDSCEVFLGNIQAAGIGINLTNSSDVIFCSLPFTPTEVDQCIDRTHRIGQRHVVNVYHTIATDSPIDERLFEMLVDKSADINALINKNNHQFQMTSIPDRLFKDLISDYKRKNKKKYETQSPAPATA